MAVDNPNLAPALAPTGVTVHRLRRLPRARAAGRSAPAHTVPRHPMNIFYNVATKADEVDEYNWIYTSRADGGSGICDEQPGLDLHRTAVGATGFDSYIVPSRPGSPTAT